MSLMNFKKYIKEIKRNKFDKWILSNYKEIIINEIHLFLSKGKRDDFHELATCKKHSSFSPCEIMKNYFKKY